MVSFAAPLCVSFKKRFWSEPYDLLWPFPNISLFLKTTQSFFFIHQVVWMFSPWSCMRALGTDISQHIKTVTWVCRELFWTAEHTYLFSWTETRFHHWPKPCHATPDWSQEKCFSTLCFMCLLFDQRITPVLSRLCRPVCSYLKRTTSLGRYQCDGP